MSTSVQTEVVLQHGWTALSRAAWDGQVEMLEALLDGGASVDIPNEVRSLVCCHISEFFTPPPLLLPPLLL